MSSEAITGDELLLQHMQGRLAATQDSMDAAERHAHSDWKRRRTEAVGVELTPMEASYPIRSAEVISAIVALHEAELVAHAAERRAEYARMTVRLARSKAVLEVATHERLPDYQDWEVNWLRLALREQPIEQSATEVVAGAQFLATCSDQDWCARAVTGDLPPFVRERVGTRGPAEFYRDLAHFLITSGEAGQELVGSILDAGSRAVAPLLHLASMVDASKATAPTNS